MSPRPNAAWCVAAIMLSLAGCRSKQPSFEEKLAADREAEAKAVAKASPAYDIIKALREKSAAPAPACDGAAPAGYMRISSNRLKTLTGEPADENGWLAANTDPAPNAANELWDAPAVHQLPAPNRRRLRAAGDPAETTRFIDESAAGILSAPGFVVQTVDHYVAPVVTKVDVDRDLKQRGLGEFTPGEVEGRVLIFDHTNVRCQYSYRATNEATIGGYIGYNGGMQGAADRDLSIAARKAIDQAMAAK